VDEPTRGQYRDGHWSGFKVIGCGTQSVHGSAVRHGIVSGNCRECRYGGDTPSVNTETATNHRTGPPSLTLKRRASCTHASTGLRPTSTLIYPDCPFYPSVFFIFFNRMPFDPFSSAIKTVPQSSEKFDEYSFRKYMHDFGRAYQNQAMELIAICRLFSQVAQQVFSQDAELTK